MFDVFFCLLKVYVQTILMIIWDAFRNLLPFVQFQKRQIHSQRKFFLAKLHILNTDVIVLLRLSYSCAWELYEDSVLGFEGC